MQRHFAVFTEGLEGPCKWKDLGDGVYGFEYYPPHSYTWARKQYNNWNSPTCHCD